MIRRPYRNATLRFYKERMLGVLVKIQEELDGPLCLDELAARAHLSPYHFHRVFRGMLGEPLMAHVRRLRLERAASRLKITCRPVIDIALEAGYDSHEAFTRAFKNAFGVPPSRYRERRGAPAVLRARSGVHFRADRRPHDFRTVNQGVRTMQVTIEKLPPQRVAFMRHVGPYAACGATWDRFVTWLGKEGLLGPGCRFIGVSHDDPEITQPGKIRYDACVTVDDSFQPEDDIGVQVISGGDYARTTHAGPYDQFNETYGRLMGQWLPRSGRQLRGAPCFEVYLNSPEDTPPAQLLTDIYVPLEPR